MLEQNWGDAPYGRDKLLAECERRWHKHLFRERQSKGGITLIRALEREGRWRSAVWHRPVRAPGLLRNLSLFLSRSFNTAEQLDTGQSRQRIWQRILMPFPARACGGLPSRCR